jgi:hypothetical protein
MEGEMPTVEREMKESGEKMGLFDFDGTSDSGGRDLLIGGEGLDAEPFIDNRVGDRFVATVVDPDRDGKDDLATSQPGADAAPTFESIGSQLKSAIRQVDVVDDDFVFQASEPTTAEGQPYCYLQYKLDRCFVKSGTPVDGDGLDHLGAYQPDVDTAAADPVPSNTSGYFTDDYSLTVIGVSSDPEFFLV